MYVVTLKVYLPLVFDCMTVFPNQTSSHLHAVLFPWLFSASCVVCCVLFLSFFFLKYKVRQYHNYTTLLLYLSSIQGKKICEATTTSCTGHVALPNIYMT